MAEEGTAVALKGVSITAAEKCIKAKEMLVGVDMPQDYSFPSDEVAAVLIGADSNIATAAKPVSSATAHAWVSPNKSDEVPSSEESSPTCDDLKINEKELAESGINANLNAEFDGEFETTESVEASDPDLSIIGKRLEVQNLVGNSNVEAVLDATGKDFIRIVHGEKAVMMVLPSVGYPLGSALDFAEALAASLDITDNIVGLRTSALAFNSQSSVFKYHGECILPFSALVSGELAKMIDSSDLSDGIPSFALITSSFDSYLTNSYQVGSVESVEALSSKEESSVGSVNDGPSYAKAFLQLMEESGDFTPFEKNALLKFGIGHAENGNILYRSSFRVAVFTGSKSYFIRGLKAIANILLNSSPEVNKGNEYNTDYPTKTSMTIFGITDFVISAEELYDSNDLSEQEYVTLLDAIIVGHASVRALFDLYHNPDFLLACDSNEDIQSSLCLRDLFHLGKKLEPLQPQPETDDGLLKWAIKTGIHNFSADVPELSQEFINIIFHMFSSGDEMVLAACEKFVETGDTGFVSEMILREWNIYCRNNTVREEDCISSPKLVQQETSECAEVPNCLLTAVACLVDEDEMANDEAVALIASYLQGDQLLHEVYGRFIEFGNVDDFLMMLKVIASTEKVNDDSARTGTVVSAEDASADVGSDFWPVLEEMKRDNQFGQVEIAALRLATAMKDPRLTQVLADYRSNCIDKETFKRFILDVADGVIEENC